MEFYIRIKWSESTEIIDVQIGKKIKKNEIAITHEYWPDENETIFYNTESTRKKMQDGSHTIKISYREDSNTHLDKNSSLWGESTIVIAPDFKSATTHWKSEYHDSENSGKAKSCSIFKKDLFEELEKELTFRNKRNQKQFREELLSTYGCCAISGDATESVLDAAHIIESSASGAGSLSNGILLRADFHRLYDARIFDINLDGTIKVNEKKKLSKEYFELLTNSKIEDHIMSRIKDSLIKR